MMGKQPPAQERLFYTGLSLEKRVRADHPLRQIAKIVDFDFVYSEVASTYGHNGHVSVAPPVVLKLMLLLVLYNVRSERELMATLPERLDWLWFLGYALDDKIPDHSVLSKARKRWGSKLFRSFFERVVVQCVQVGLVDGSKLFMDSSLVQADASLASLVDTGDLRQRLSPAYRTLESRLEDDPSAREPGRYATTNSRLFSATDPDAAPVSRGGTALRYQVHRSVDERAGVITATATTPGDVNEAHKMMDLVQAHESTTGLAAEVVVADGKYGTHENFLACHDAGLKAHLGRQGKGTDKRLKKRGLFSEELFKYEPGRDVFVCPAGKELHRRTLHKSRQSVEYMAKKKVCAACELRDKCTRSNAGRSLIRHLRQDELDTAIQEATSERARRNLRRRQVVAEGSFAQAMRYGYKRARWRRLWRVEIQELLTCTVQNIAKLLQASLTRSRPAVALRAGIGALRALMTSRRCLVTCVDVSTSRVLADSMEHQRDRLVPINLQELRCALQTV